MYEKTEWTTGDVITSNKLNKMEAGIAESAETIASLVKERDDYAAEVELFSESTTLSEGAVIELADDISAYSRIAFVFSAGSMRENESKFFNVEGRNDFPLSAVKAESDGKTVVIKTCILSLNDATHLSVITATSTEIKATTMSAVSQRLSLERIIGYRTSGDAEIEDARHDSDGTEYDTIGQAIRLQIANALSGKADEEDIDALSARIDRLIQKGIVADADAEIRDLRIDCATGAEHETARSAHKADYDALKAEDENLAKKIVALQEASFGGLTCDTELSETSENPVQNKVIAVEIENLKKSVSDGKTLLAGAITEKGIETASDDTFETMAENISSIESGSGGICIFMQKQSFANTNHLTTTTTLERKES